MMARPALGTGTPGRHDLVLPLTAIAKKKKNGKKNGKKNPRDGWHRPLPTMSM